MSLSRRQKDFCQFYLHSHSATRAAAEAGYSRKNSAKQGWRLLQMPAVLVRIAELRADIARRAAADPAALIAKLEAPLASAIYVGEYHAVARLVELQAKLAGHLGHRASAEKTEALVEREVARKFPALPRHQRPRAASYRAGAQRRSPAPGV